MRLAVSHTTVYRYERPAKNVIQTLKLTPRNHAAQHIVRWRAEIDADAKLRQSEDAFGNIIHSLNAAGPIETFSIRVEGEVDTIDRAGVLAGAVERFPPELYLRATDLTTLNPDMAEYADAVRKACDESDGMLSVMHALMNALNRDMNFDGEASANAKASDAFAVKRGGGQDFAQAFCAMARHLGAPARYVAGYVSRPPDGAGQIAGHAWAEAHVPGLGWVGFDPVQNICAADAHIRVAMGLDGLGAAPVRASQTGGGPELLDVAIKVTQLQMQS